MSLHTRHFYVLHNILHLKNVEFMYENDGHLNKRLFIASYPFLSCVLFLLFACKNIEWNRDNRTEQRTVPQTRDQR